MNKKRKVLCVGFKGNKILIGDYILCKGFFSKMRGLMFRPRNFKTPLVFVFDKPERFSIHSFFCRKFLAIWMLKGKVVDVKIIRPWKANILPKKPFDTLIETPFNSTKQISEFSVGS